MTKLIPFENVNTRRIYDMAKEYGYSIYTVFKKPKKSDSPETVKALMDEYKIKNVELRDKLIQSRKFFFPIYAFYKDKQEAIAYLHIWKNIGKVYDYYVVRNFLETLAMTTHVRISQEKGAKNPVLWTMEMKKQKSLKLPEDITFIDLIKTFYNYLDDDYEEDEKEKDTFKFYLPYYDKEYLPKVNRLQLLLEDREYLGKDNIYKELNFLI